MKKVKLANGVLMDEIGYGTYKVKDEDPVETITLALETGYRLLDTASFYENETYIAKAIKAAGIKREELFLTSKVWKTQMGYEQTKKAFNDSLEALETDYLDLYLIHWPRRDNEENHMPSFDGEDTNWRENDIATWQALEELYQEGKVRGIGVCNFQPHHLQNLFDHGKIKPMVNQIEAHVGYYQPATLDFCKANDIVVQAWAPLARGLIFKDPTLMEIAHHHGVSVAQVCLKFLLQMGITIIPKASSAQRMKDNKDLDGFELSEEQMHRLRGLPMMGWSGLHPDRQRYLLP